MFTGDDFNYVGLIEGDDEQFDAHSDALLGAFAALAPNASAAIQALDADDPAEYRASSARPRRWPGTSSPRRPTTTRPAWPSCPG